MTPGSPPAALAQFLRRRHWPSQRTETFGTPNTPTRPHSVGNPFRGFLLRPFATTRRLACPPVGPDRTLRVEPSGAFTPELSPGRSPFSASGMTIMATEHLHERDFHPQKRSLASLHPYDGFREKLKRTQSRRAASRMSDAAAAVIAGGRPFTRRTPLLSRPMDRILLPTCTKWSTILLNTAGRSKTQGKGLGGRFPQTRSTKTIWRNPLPASPTRVSPRAGTPYRRRRRSRPC
jgi:hypothetical protein